MEMDLSKKVALITGSSKGIGSAIAIALAKEGCSVVINFKSDAAGAQKTLEECNKYSKENVSIKTDVSSENEVDSLFAQIEEKFKHLDILINNAGIFDKNDGPTNVEAFENIYRNNFLSIILVIKYALPLMKVGKIINISSIHGKLGQGRPEASAYSAFKAALENYTKNLAKDLAPNILVNAIAPGKVITSMWGNPTMAEQKELGKAHLIGRMIQPEEIASSAIFLAKNNAVCGEILTVDGGWV